ncbi:MAG TPA: putative zinc-binding peptidase [Nitrosomonas sp.]|nr:putative zinc-binding peptidase [Nitrosomonas sp.]
MKTFRCHCGNHLHFENSQCFSCNRMVGYLPEEKRLSALEPSAEGNWLALFNNRPYRQCKNFVDYNVCNWMVSARDNHALCLSCRLNHIIPNLNEAQNITLWYRVEQAKRRLLYTLYSLDLPVVSREKDPSSGMGFEFLQDDVAQDEFSNELTIRQSIATGHKSGMITINLLEAEHSSRLEMRDKMNERYRTLLGHFRHESGHYYWDRLINNTDKINSFRDLFGDERLDYQQALRTYYEQGPSSFWQDIWISAYASSHAWEDWAETWAHYLHMVDTVETAHDFSFSIHGYDVSAPAIDSQMANGYKTPASFDELFDDWCRLSVALNALNRSMGMDDAYPFVISSTSLNKLRYVHQIVTGISRQSLSACLSTQTAATAHCNTD